jgi:hypothetical protein
MRVLIPVLAAAAALTAGWAEPAAAYVGPGAGLSLLGAFWGLVLAIGAALAFVILWPVRRMLKRRRASGTAAAGGVPQQPAAEAVDPAAAASQAVPPRP